MKILKPHFWYNKRQRNGVFFLVLIIVLLQVLYAFVDFSSEKIIDINTEEIKSFQKQIDSLKLVELESKKPKIYPFNPNYINDFKGYQLGMSVEEIDRLLAFRKQNKWINSVEDFKSVTKVSDSLLAVISPYFKFPDWVVKKGNAKKIGVEETNPSKNHIYNKVYKISTNDLNKATQQDFESISGVGEVLAERIIKYRNKLQGYSLSVQLYEVWGLNKETANAVLQTFKIVEKPNITKVNVNTAIFKEVLKNPYIDYELCKKIFEYRDEVAELQYISELRNIKDFPLDKYDRIVIYLEAK
ncbi:helix-hairpin-helix domain-containing protein [Tenacibaculum crassostreae]|uniref:helix-hairpin-helix domain-containing protein n=1 Tax=Tenacibaculum crassostreae TaxID=502683 RepID=UPI003894195F